MKKKKKKKVTQSHQMVNPLKIGCLRKGEGELG